MTHDYLMHRQPYRRGDYQLVDSSREGTYWRSREGVVVRLASGASSDHGCRTRPGWTYALAVLAARLASG
jgi:hypothetical protein